MSDPALSNEDLRALYKELILEHARSPRNFGSLPGATHSSRGSNPLCGDNLRLFLRVDGEEISEACFEGTGCAISVASASLLTETVRGMSRSDALSFSDMLVNRLKTGKATAAAPSPGKLRALDGVREFPSRVKCATLAWHALNSAINMDEARASTE